MRGWGSRPARRSAECTLGSTRHSDGGLNGSDTGSTQGNRRERARGGGDHRPQAERRRVGEVPLPREAARDSEVLDQDAVAAALRQLWTVARIKRKEVMLGVGSRRTLVREYTTQAMAPESCAKPSLIRSRICFPCPCASSARFLPHLQQGDQVSGLLVAAVAEND